MVVILIAAGEFRDRAREIRGGRIGELIEQRLEFGEVPFGKLADIGVLAAGRSFFAAVRAAELEIERAPPASWRRGLRIRRA